MSDMEIYRQKEAFSGEDRLRRIIPVADLYVHAPFLKQPFGNIASVSVQVAPSSQFR
jgi:hypothetical protein